MTPEENKTVDSFVSVNCDRPFLMVFSQFWDIFFFFILFFLLFLRLVRGNYVLLEIGCESFYKDMF